MPGECVLAPKGGGRVQVRVRDGRSGAEASRWIRARAGRVQTISVRGPLKMKVVERRRCGDLPYR